MKSESAVQFEGESRVHVGLEVADLNRSFAFYRVLLGVDPVKERPGYAKFEPRAPSVNLSLNEACLSLDEGRGGRVGRPGGSQHFGLQVQSSEAVEAMAARFRRAGLAVRVEQGTTCCYAVQDKVWVQDPDGNPWEVFVVVQADADRRVPSGPKCCGSQVELPSCCGGA